MKIETVQKVEWEVGDKCFDKLHNQEAIVLFIHRSKRNNFILVEHTSEDKYLALKSADEIEPIAQPIKEMTVEEVSKLVGATVKIID